MSCDAPFGSNTIGNYFLLHTQYLFYKISMSNKSNMQRRPWNRVNLPVYSAATYYNGKHNMNICTYVSAVSMKPKRFMVAVYKGTQTLKNIENNPHFILQILASSQYPLVTLLGKQSGKNIDKTARLEKRCLLDSYKNFLILKDAIAVIELSMISKTDAGDHWMCLCDTLSYKNIHDGEVLTLDELRRRKLIR